MITGGLGSRGGQLTHGLNAWDRALEQLLEIIAIIQLSVMVRAAGAAGVWSEATHDGTLSHESTRRLGATVAPQHDADISARDHVTLPVRLTSI